MRGRTEGGCTVHADLITRLEAATGPDRRLADEVAAARAKSPIAEGNNG
jgi:hypothetical protein